MVMKPVHVLLTVWPNHKEHIGSTLSDANVIADRSKSRDQRTNTSTQEQPPRILCVVNGLLKHLSRGMNCLLTFPIREPVITPLLRYQ